MFSEFARFFSQSITVLYNNVVYLYSSSIFMFAPISKAYDADAAHDLSLDRDYLIRPFEKVKLVFNEKIVIPVNFAAFLCTRSLINLCGCLRVGLVDAPYSGQLSAIFIADSEEVAFKKDQRVAQLVILPTVQLPVIVSPEALLPSLNRGQNCLGSTGKF